MSLGSSFARQNQQTIPEHFSPGTYSKFKITCELLLQYRGDSTQARQVQGIRENKIEISNLPPLDFSNLLLVFFASNSSDSN